MTWLEAMPPLVIITVALGAVGGLQQSAHRLYHGRKKKVQGDHFTLLMDRRDERLEREAAATAAAGAGKQ